ncbi:hypothetical protein Glove_74g178 [Diversispora epigaea]|uniref:Uncharacterized protein n=1 Tax=Diversispora epigaea TaxID=1348612 RepID=A0A397J9X5_9GLOM|nr:hypothetical protein Glove_74g178 [Diversispora epigaea]
MFFGLVKWRRHLKSGLRNGAKLCFWDPEMATWDRDREMAQYLLPKSQMPNPKSQIPNPKSQILVICAFWRCHLPFGKDIILRVT